MMSDKLPGEASPNTRYLAIGHIVGVHGIRGEVKVEVLTDFPERFQRRGAGYFWAAKAKPDP